ncbi:MAG: hypothetical protein HN368_09315 [Spirochaetales bacterium]|jgi:hypothetical protein|nr:hypothetical protein [Spirochaetales bacterium]
MISELKQFISRNEINLIFRHSCRRVRGRMMLFLDSDPSGEDLSMDPLLRDHLHHCSSCSGFLSGILEIRTEYHEVFEESFKDLCTPGVPAALPAARAAAHAAAHAAIHVEEKSHHLAFFTRIAAAIILAGFLVTGGYYSVRAINTRNFIRSENVLFVDEIFSQALFETNVDIANAGLFSPGSDLVEGLILPSPYEVELSDNF